MTNKNFKRFLKIWILFITTFFTLNVILARAGGGGSSSHSSSSSSHSSSHSSSYSSSHGGGGGNHPVAATIVGAIFFIIFIVLPIYIYKRQKRKYILGKKNLLERKNDSENKETIEKIISEKLTIKEKEYFKTKKRHRFILLAMFVSVLYFVLQISHLLPEFSEWLTVLLVFAAFIIAALSLFGHYINGAMMFGNLLDINNILENIDSEINAYIIEKEKLNTFIADHPDFLPEKFLEKVKTAFMEIQKAWSLGEMSPVRRFISDGIYQRYRTQLEIMQLLKQRNTLDNIQIHNLDMVAFQSSGNFDVIQVKIEAQMEDRFICKMDSTLNENCDDDFVEYWSFIRKKGITHKDIYSSNKCPSCGANLNKDMGEVAQCEYCGAMVNSGEYDWVLSEITQQDDYLNPQSAKYRDNVDSNLFKDDPDFSIQEIEDKVSNGYLQLLSAHVFRQPERMRRFVSDELYEKIKNEIPESVIAYNRLFLNEVAVVEMEKSNDIYNLKVFLRQTHQKIELKEIRGKLTLHLLDDFLKSENVSVSLSRKAGNGQNKGSIYAHICPACGGNIKDTLEIKCQYCGTSLNSVVNDWIITGLEKLSGEQSHKMSDDNFLGTSFVGGSIFSDDFSNDSRDDNFSGDGGSFGGGGSSGDWDSDSDSSSDSDSDSDSSDSDSD